MAAAFDIDTFKHLLEVQLPEIIYQQEIPSTNDLAKERINTHNAESGTLILAENQTAGRGRADNLWQSHPYESLLFTLILEPETSPQHLHRFALTSALAIIQSLQTFSINAQIKWPNDIYLNDKKLGGILIESIKDRLIIGIGLNTSQTSFPSSIATKATSLLLEDKNIQREPLLANIIKHLFQLSSIAESKFTHIIKETNQVNFLNNKHITLTAHGKQYTGIASHISEHGELTLLINNTPTTFIQAENIQFSKGE